MNRQNLKRRIFDIIQIGNQNDTPSRVFDIFLVCVIVVNIAAMFLETFDELQSWRGVFHAVETVTVLVFCVEYALRIWTAEYLFPGRGRGRAVWNFLRSYDGVIDLLTILPFFFLSGFVVFRLLRVVRIFHLFRINTRYDSFNVIKSVLYEKRNQIASSVFIVVILMLASSLFLYSVEHEAQPQAFRNALSGIWWSVSTLLTVGYGDIYPVTVLGRAMAIVITFLGVGVVAIPTGIISAGFVEQYTKLQQETPALTGELTAITLGVDSAWKDRAVKDVEEEYHIDIVLIRRKGKVSAAKAGFVMKTGDQVAYL